jgi:hypothetical protein
VSIVADATPKALPAVVPSPAIPAKVPIAPPTASAFANCAAFVASSTFFLASALAFLFATSSALKPSFNSFNLVWKSF